METVTLLGPTGGERTDRAASATIGVFTTGSPGRFWAYYLEGRRANSTGVTTSDLNLTVVFGGSTGDEERDRTAQLAGYCAVLSAVELDIDLIDEARLSCSAPLMLKLFSHLLCEEDVLAQAPLMAFEEWTRDRMHSSYWLMVKGVGRPPIMPIRLV